MAPLAFKCTHPVLKVMCRHPLPSQWLWESLGAEKTDDTGLSWGVNLRDLANISNPLPNARGRAVNLLMENELHHVSWLYYALRPAYAM